MKSFDRNTTLYMLVLLLCLCSQKKRDQLRHKARILASAEASAHALKRRKKKRILWSKVDVVLNERQFRRMFCMTRQCFAMLLDKIKISVGGNIFKSEVYIDTFWIPQGVYIMRIMKQLVDLYLEKQSQLLPSICLLVETTWTLVSCLIFLLDTAKF